MSIRRYVEHLAVVSLVLVASLLIGCSSARRGEPIVGPISSASPEATQGQKVFMKHCHQCHPGGEAELGPALNNNRCRNSSCAFKSAMGWGAMPAFSEQDISEEDLDHLLAYLKN